MNPWKITLGTAAAAAACATCCALPVVPVLLAGLGLSGTSFAVWGEQGLLLALLGVGGSYAVWRWMRYGAALAGKTSCACGPASGCNRGSACDVPSKA